MQHPTLLSGSRGRVRWGWNLYRDVVFRIRLFVDGGLPMQEEMEIEISRCRCRCSGTALSRYEVLSTFVHGSHERLCNSTTGPMTNGYSRNLWTTLLMYVSSISTDILNNAVPSPTRASNPVREPASATHLAPLAGVCCMDVSTLSPQIPSFLERETSKLLESGSRRPQSTVRRVFHGHSIARPHASHHNCKQLDHRSGEGDYTGCVLARP